MSKNPAAQVSGELTMIFAGLSSMFVNGLMSGVASAQQRRAEEAAIAAEVANAIDQRTRQANAIIRRQKAMIADLTAHLKQMQNAFEEVRERVMTKAEEQDRYIAELEYQNECLMREIQQRDAEEATVKQIEQSFTPPADYSINVDINAAPVSRTPRR